MGGEREEKKRRVVDDFFFTYNGSLYPKIAVGAETIFHINIT